MKEGRGEEGREMVLIKQTFFWKSFLRGVSGESENKRRSKKKVARGE
jgi:hypothetical protein